MKSRQHIVVSAENNPYLAWQCKLFHYSCVSRLEQTPLFVVHQFDKGWCSDFKDIVNSGGKVRSAPTYRTTKGGEDYAPRNTAGTLLQAAVIGYNRKDFIVLCDPDMIFVRKPAFVQRLAAEYYSYLNYDKPEVREAARNFGISDALLKKRVPGGVPHIVPVAQALEIGEAWLEAVDSFATATWENIMYAFGLAVIKLRLEMTLTRQVATNYGRRDLVKSADIIHYCYGNDLWNKRHYFSGRKSAQVWRPQARASAGTVLGEIVSQLNEARNFYATKHVAALR